MTIETVTTTWTSGQPQWVKFTLWGGGGGSQNDSGGGGGGGCRVEVTVWAEADDQFTPVRGNGGSIDSNGQDSTVSRDAVVIARAKGGAKAVGSSGGITSTAGCVGDTITAGSPGQDATGGNGGAGGAGGAPGGGAGGAGGVDDDGAQGTAPGGGAGGGSAGNLGSAGAVGRVQVEYPVEAPLTVSAMAPGFGFGSVLGLNPV